MTNSDMQVFIELNLYLETCYLERKILILVLITY